MPFLLVSCYARRNDVALNFVCLTRSLLRVCTQMRGMTTKIEKIFIVTLRTYRCKRSSVARANRGVTTISVPGIPSCMHSSLFLFRYIRMYVHVQRTLPVQCNVRVNVLYTRIKKKAGTPVIVEYIEYEPRLKTASKKQRVKSMFANFVTVSR